MALDGMTDQNAIDAADVQGGSVLQSINGGPSVGPGTFFSEPSPAGYVASDNGAADLAQLWGGGSFLSSVPMWAWLVLGGAIVFAVIRRR